MSEEKSISMKELAELLAAQEKRNQENLKTIIQELRKPTVLEQQKLDEDERAKADNLIERRENGASQIHAIEQRRAWQRTCSHKHNSGHSHCVKVEPSGPADTVYILCQNCQVKIRPGVPPVYKDKRGNPVEYKGDDIYDTGLFNRTLQEMPSSELFQ